MEYLKELTAILNEMSPYLLLGFLISGLLHVYVPHTIYSRFLKRKGVSSVVGAALLGVPLPLCSCGVIPTAVSLKKEGASDGATVSFLVATPQTGVDSILATYSLLGLPFAIIRAIAAFVIAIFSGVLVDRFGSDSQRSVAKLRAIDGGGCSCGCSHGKDCKEEKSLWSALRYGYVDMMQDFGKWLIFGLLIAAAITAYIPDNLFSLFKEHYLLNILLIILISAPMYVCATGSIPIALSLIMKGVTPGAAFVLLIAGPATNIASLIILKREIGIRKSIIYLISIMVGALFFALVIDFFSPERWFSELMSLNSGVCEHDHHDYEVCTHGPIWWQTTCSILFVILFVNATIRRCINRN